MKRLIGTVLAGIALGATLAAAQGADIEIDFGTATGPVKPVHAAGRGPLLSGSDFSMFRYLKEAGGRLLQLYRFRGYADRTGGFAVMGTRRGRVVRR